MMGMLDSETGYSVFIKSKYFLLLPMLLVKNERVMHSDSVVGMTNKALLASNMS